MEPIIPPGHETKQPIKKHGKRRVIKKVSSSREENFEDDPGSPIKEYEEEDRNDFIVEEKKVKK